MLSTPAPSTQVRYEITRKSHRKPIPAPHEIRPGHGPRPARHYIVVASSSTQPGVGRRCRPCASRVQIWSFFDKGEPAAEEWVAAQARKILHGKSAQVAAGIRRRATTYGYSAAERAGADEAARYLDNKKDYLDYATALAKGWPIATGIIEGACRHIVKDRMDITGARWGLEGAEAILKLRALIATGDLEDYWRFHLRREHERIHHARYRDGLILAA